MYCTRCTFILSKFEGGKGRRRRKQIYMGNPTVPEFGSRKFPEFKMGGPNSLGYATPTYSSESEPFILNLRNFSQFKFGDCSTAEFIKKRVKSGEWRLKFLDFTLSL